MAIPATDPTVVPATTQMTYDTWWITNISISGADPNARVSASATLQKAGLLPDGVTLQLSPVDPPVNINVPDILALAQVNPDVGLAFTNLVAAIQALGTAQGLL